MNAELPPRNDRGSVKGAILALAGLVCGFVPIPVILNSMHSHSTGGGISASAMQSLLMVCSICGALGCGQMVKNPTGKVIAIVLLVVFFYTFDLGAVLAVGCSNSALR